MADMQTLVKKAHDVRAARREKEQKSRERQDFLDQTEKLEQTREASLRSTRLLIEYLEGRTSKTEVTNHPESISTPDIDQAVKALQDLQQTVKDKGTDFTPVIDSLVGLREEISTLPREFPKPLEAKDSIKINNLQGIEGKLDKLETSIRDKEMVVEAPNVNVAAPKISIPKVDLTPLQDSIAELARSFEAIEIPMPEKVNLLELEEAQKKANALLQRIVDKPVPAAPSQVAVTNPDGSLVGTGDASKLMTDPYDYFSVAYTATTDTYTYREGGSGGTIVGVVVITYVDSTKDEVDTAERTV